MTINRIIVNVDANYLEHESNPEKKRYIFSYEITIKNLGDIPARLLSRYWKIIGGNGLEQEIEGDGVIGYYPYIEPEKEFVYTSAAMLDTPVGMMQGHYKMIADGGERFEVDIPAFTLAMPEALH